MSSPQQRRTRTAPGGTNSGGGGAGGSYGSRAGLSRTHSLASPGGRMASRTSSSLSAVEEAGMAAAQELASVMNAPPVAGGNWLAAWPFTQAFGQEDYDAPPPPLPPGTLPEVQLSDFSRYLRSVGDRLESLERSREATQQRMANALSPEELRSSQGQGLVAAMREVPAPFFQEGFDLDQKQLWEELVQVDSEEAQQESLERLSGYLDVVETHLVREIAARTDNFFDASGYIQDVRGSVVRLYQQVAALRQQMHGLEQETGAAVETSRQLQQRRANLTSALEVLATMEAAAQAQAALQGLLPRSGGVAVDYAGAIDVLEVLQGVLDDEALLALDCFKHLPGQIVETAQAVDDLMTSDFMERTRFPASSATAGTAGILDRLRLQVALQEASWEAAAGGGAASLSSRPRRRRTSSQSGGGGGSAPLASSSLAPSRQLSGEESAELATLAALRLEDGSGAMQRVVGWLERTCTGTGTGTAGGGGSSMGGVSDMSSISGSRGGGGGAPEGPGPAALAAFAAADGGGEDMWVEEEGDGETLQEVLLPLVIGMRRMGRLGAAMRDLKEASAAGLKHLLSQVIEGCLEVLDPESAPGDSSHLLPAHRSLSPGRGGQREPGGGAGATDGGLGARLARLPGQDFEWVLEAVALATQMYLNHCTAVGEAVQIILTAAKASKPQLTAAAREAKECCQAVAEAAAGRWSKLLSCRARGGGGEGGGGSSGNVIRLVELQGVLQLTDLLASLVEQYGVRGVLGLRSALQQLCKAALDGLHSKSLSKMATLLEQEQWMAVEVAPQFQELARQLEERGAAAAGTEPAVAAAAAAAAAGAAVGGTSSHTAPAAEGSSGPGGRRAAAGADDGNSGIGESSGAGGGSGGVLRKFTITPPEGGSAPSGSAQQQGQQQQANGASAASAPAGGPAAAAAASGRPSPVLVVGGRGYHVVNTQLLLLSMLRDYLAFRDAVPAFGAEVAQRVLELLKVFNSRTCQLVLGAGAMQVSGLKSITAKHLALSCQCLGAFMALQPALVAAFTQGLLPPRRDMLVADFGRALQDYRIHHEEVCTKLVSIMRERLSANLKQLPALAAAWPAGGGSGSSGSGRLGRSGEHEGYVDALPAPSSFATTAAKQLNILSGAVSGLLLPEELHSIFGRIGLMFSRTLAEAYELLEPHGAAWELQLRADMQFLLNCLRNLPMDPTQRDSNLERLTTLFEQRFLLGPAAAAAAAAAPVAATAASEPPQRPRQVAPTSASAPAQPPAVAATAAAAESVGQAAVEGAVQPTPAAAREAPAALVQPAVAVPAQAAAAAAAPDPAGEGQGATAAEAAAAEAAAAAESTLPGEGHGDVQATAAVQALLSGASELEESQPAAPGMPAPTAAAEDLLTPLPPLEATAEAAAAAAPAEGSRAAGAPMPEEAQQQQQAPSPQQQHPVPQVQEQPQQRAAEEGAERGQPQEASHPLWEAPAPSLPAMQQPQQDCTSAEAAGPADGTDGQADPP